MSPEKEQRNKNGVTRRKYITAESTVMPKVSIQSERRYNRSPITATALKGVQLSDNASDFPKTTFTSAVSLKTVTLAMQGLRERFAVFDSKLDSLSNRTAQVENRCQ
ncbi:hypothetical protein KIL84_015266 [Mauremys mutica]|uniref:Uncharacterized protein n=1 Tax=Mauremys mutica TaxID=74926 RepID=A0A9D4APU2_9SAUR|nr:hypothetical protein KIL84_015266 [Mauremys mutica]